MREDLFSELERLWQSDMYPMHMPGHKRNTTQFAAPDPYGLDITEIDGFDDLHHAQGLLRESMELAAQVFRAERTFYLVNGSTAGLLIGIFAATERGDTVLMARNCHRAVYHAAELRELVPVYLLPEQEKETGIFLGVSAKEVRRALAQHPETALVIVTSPTYEGVVSDLAEIVEAAHEAGVPLLVDEAHGAHFGFHEYFPKNSNYYGADLVVQSMHKTLPAFTQTALLHCNGDRVSREKIEGYSAMFQTSSPSYLLMASMDRCVRYLASEEGRRQFAAYAKRLEAFYRETAGLRALKVRAQSPRMQGELSADRQKGAKDAALPSDDPSKIVIFTKNISMTGRQLYDILREVYHIQPEMASQRYVLCMTSPADTQEGFLRLAQALYEIDRRAQEETVAAAHAVAEHEGAAQEASEELPAVVRGSLPECVLAPQEAKRRGRERCLLTEAEGRIAAKELLVYPPGIPLLVAGERIGREQIEALCTARQQGLTVYGVAADGTVPVVCAEEKQAEG